MTREQVREPTVVTTYRTITLEVAGHAIKAYNDGTYGRLKNPVIDRQALEMFADGLGSTSGKIGRQVEFIGRDYGGAAGFKAAYELVPDITRDIVANRERYEQTAASAPPVLSQIASRGAIEILYHFRNDSSRSGTVRPHVLRST